MRRASSFVLLALALLLVAPAVGAEVLDPTYGEAGRTRATFDDFDPIGSYIGVIDDAGRSLQLGVSRGLTKRLVRFDQDGQLDRVFGDDGEVRLPDGIPAWVRGVAGHGVVVGGYARAASGGGGVDYYILRLTESGDPDPRFGDAGLIRIPDEADVHISPLALGPDGELLLERRTFTPNGYIKTWELHRESGALDPSFGTAGVLPDPSTGLEEHRADVAIDATGGIYFVDAAGVVRLRHDGQPDPDFGAGGTVALPGSGTDPEFALDLDEDSIVVGRQVDDGTTSIWRLTADGELDDAFPVQPIVWDLPNPGAIEIEALALGRTAVTSDDNRKQDVLVLAPNGMPDPGWSMGPRTFTGHMLLGISDGGVPGQLIVARSNNQDISSVSRYLLDEGGLPAPVVSSVVGRPDGVTVTWEVPDALDEAAVAYHVVLVHGTMLGGHVLVAGDVRSASVEGLEPGEFYEAFVIPYLRTGAGPRSEPAGAFADPGGPPASTPGPVGQVQTVAGDRWIRVAWTPGPDNGSPIAVYSVVAIDQMTGRLAGWRNLPADVRTAVVPGLTNGRTYDVYVLAWNSKGIGQATAQRVVPSAGASLGGPPSVPWVGAVRSGDATYVAWSAPLEHGDEIVGFDVVVIEDGAMISWAQPAADQRRLVLPAPRAGTVTQVYVFAHSASGFGPIGSPVAP